MTGSRAAVRARRDARQRGFTLLEVMVSLAIFGLIAAAGVAVMAYAADSQQALRERMARLGEFQRARALLRTDLSQAATRLARRTDARPRRRIHRRRPDESGRCSIVRPRPPNRTRAARVASTSRTIVPGYGAQRGPR